MSASLVGSEMCIRDRLTVPSGVLRCDVRPMAKQHRATELSAVSSLGAVSYTHLTLPTICSV
eukprot:6363846-Alexandrium_andersonii.AAC.1